jgi:rubrerythrin
MKLSRADLIRRGALAVGGAYGLGMVGPYITKALAGAAGDDVEILNFLLPFEYLQASLYNRGVKEVNAKGQKMRLSGEQRRFVTQLAGEEREHVEAVEAMIEKLGGKPVAKAGYAFAFTGFYVFEGIAQNLETTAVGAYNGVIPMIRSKEVRELAGSIVQVEARHLAALKIRASVEPAPEAFDRPSTQFSAISSVEKYTGTF